MDTNQSKTNDMSLWTDTVAGAIRAAFGLVWGLDAYFKWQPDFFNNYLSYISSIIAGQPKWLLLWFNFWNNLISLNPSVFAWLTRIVETLIALGLLIGFARKWVYLLGAGFALLIWAIPEGFGGPYTPGATDVGAGLIYVFVFIALILLDYVLGRSPYSLDFYLEKRFPAWRAVAEWAPAQVLEKEPRYLSWPIQIITIIGLVVMLVIFLTILGSELNSAATSSAPALQWFNLHIPIAGLGRMIQFL